MSIKYDLFDCIEPANIYLCKPKQSASCALNGIDKNSFSYSTFLQDIDNITFTVNRYIEIDGEKQESNGYSDIDYLMEVLIDNIGTFIIDTPPTINKDDVETKEVSAKSCEWEMLSRDLVSFKVNTGEDTSIERLIDNNIDVSGRTVNYVSLYDKYNPEYSLLDIIINEKIPDWSVGYVNPIIAVKTPYFDIDSTNVYAFFTQDISKKLQCIFKFDTINRKINIYSADEIGNDTGISISRNILNQLSIEPQTSDIFTRYKVFGNDELDISQVNFGSDTIEDISYYLNSKYMPQELIDKYNNYIEYKESKRQSYIDKMKEYITTLETRNELVNRVPLDSLNYDWDAFSKEELKEELSYFQGLVNIILKDMLPTSFNYSSNRNSVASFINNHKTTNNMKLYKKQLHLYIHEIDKLIDSYIQNSTSENLEKIIDNIASITTANDLQNILNGAFNYFEMIDYTELQNSMYWWDYEAYTTSIIPNIDIALDNLNLTGDDKKEYNENWKTNWELYGLNELKAQKELYKNKVESVKEYSKPWSNLSSDEKIKYSSEQSYTNLYNEYLKMQTLLNEVSTQYNIIKSKVERYDGELNFLQNELSLISSDVSIKNESFNFTEKDLSILRCFYIDAEYTNENFLVTSYTTSIEKLDVELELLDYAKEDIAKQSRPQYHFSCNIDNIFAMAEYKLWQDSLQNGNFIWVSLDDYNYDKVRIVGITYNPMIPNDNNLEIEFSNMTIWNGKRSDLTNLFDNATSSTSNSISRGSSSSNSSSSEISNELIRYILNSKPMSDNLEEQELKRIVANEAQFKVVLADYVTANVMDVKVVNAIKSTLNEAFIKNLIVGHITAADIFSTNIGTEYLKIGENDEGAVYINGSTIQFRDKNDNVYIQLGTDAQGGHSLIVKDENGIALLNGSGITANAIADELIVDKMVKKKDKDTNYNGISADALDIDSVVKTINNDGTIIVRSSKVYFDEDNQTLETKLSEMTTDINKHNEQFSKYYTKEETTDIVKTTIGETSIAELNDGEAIKTSLNTVINTANSHTQTIEDIETNLRENYSTTNQTKSEISQTKDSIMLSVENLSSVVGGSGKNLLNNVAESTVKNDLEFTVHTDKTVTVNGTPSVYTYLKLGEFDVEIDKTYRISGCPTGGNSDSGYFLLSQGENNYFETGEGFEFKSNLNETRTLYIGVRANCTIDNLLFKPMVTFANISNLEYEPHTNTVDEKIASIKVEADKISLIVKGEDSEGNVELTDNALNVIAENINLTGKVTFGDLTADAVESINDNLSIGGTNLIYGTKRMDKWVLTNNNIQSVIIDDNGYGVAHWDRYSTLGWQGISSVNSSDIQPLNLSDLLGKEITISLDVKSEDYELINAESEQGIVIVFALCNTDSITRAKFRTNTFYDYTLTDKWQRLSYTTTLTENYFSSGSGEINESTRFYIQIYDHSVYSMDVRKVKLELGNKATDYSQNPNDIENSIYYPNTTIINGGNIMTNSIKADAIDVDSLYADKYIKTPKLIIRDSVACEYSNPLGEYIGENTLLNVTQGTFPEYTTISGVLSASNIVYGRTSSIVGRLSGSVNFATEVEIPKLYISDILLATNMSVLGTTYFQDDAAFEKNVYIKTLYTEDLESNMFKTNNITIEDNNNNIISLVPTQLVVSDNNNSVTMNSVTIDIGNDISNTSITAEGIVTPSISFGKNVPENKIYKLSGNGTGWFNHVVSYGNQYHFWKDESGYIPTLYYNSNKVTLGATDLNASLLFKGNGENAIEYIGNRFRCNTSGVNALGDSEHLWTQLYVIKSTIETSDRNKKRNINYLSNDDKYVQLFKKIMPCSYMFINGDRVHIGAIAQDIEDSLKECGLSNEEFGGFCKDIHYIYDKDSDGNDIEETKRIAYDESGNIIYNYGLRYEEFIMLTVFVVQKNMERLEHLEFQMENILARLDALEGKH